MYRYEAVARARYPWPQTQAAQNRHATLALGNPDIIWPHVGMLAVAAAAGGAVGYDKGRSITSTIVGTAAGGAVGYVLLATWAYFLR